MKAPMRYYMIRLLIENKRGLTARKIYFLLEKEYGSERQCTLKRVDQHLMSMKSVSLVEIRDALLNKNDELEIIYRMTEDGLFRAQKYISEFLVQN